MIRKLAIAVSLAVGSTLSLSAYALGLGEIRTSSALNEKFKGEIELLSVKKGDLDTLKVGLAPEDVFQRAGLERTAVLRHLRFKTVRKRNGKALILVSILSPSGSPSSTFSCRSVGPTANWCVNTPCCWILRLPPTDMLPAFTVPSPPWLAEPFPALRLRDRRLSRVVVNTARWG